MHEYIKMAGTPSAKILVEYKQTGNFPRHSKEEAAVREREEERRYAPQLASLLASSSNDFADQRILGTLPFKGYARDATEHNSRYVFAFEYPKGSLTLKPLSLHYLIGSSNGKYRLSLSDRFHVAKMIARCLGTLHSDGWLHKSIRSNAIKFFFHDVENTPKLDTSTPYLTEFGFSRPVGAFSAGIESSIAVDLALDVYRHPHRFGEPSDIFNMVHDVYSLGVVLLEIGVWKTAKQLYDEFVQAKFNGSGKPTGQDVRKAFVDVARQELEHRMGSAYMDAVVLCLDGKQLLPQLDKPQFAIAFQRDVVQKVDIAYLHPTRPEFEDEPPRYDDVVSS
jgi:serine/threonine protein kinase